MEKKNKKELADNDASRVGKGIEAIYTGGQESNQKHVRAEA